MPFVVLNADSWKKGLSRALIVGPPNSRKTTSLLTWPGPQGIVSYPGEKGYASIPVGRDGLTAYVWEDDVVTKTSPTALVKEIETCTFDLLARKTEPLTTFCGDGLHKLYGAYINEASNGAYAAGDDFEAKLYSRAHESFLHYLNRVMHSKVPYVVFTCWDGKEADNPEAGSKSPTHIYPDLPGKMAKRIMGEFSVVLYASVSPPIPGQPQKATWQLQPGGKVWGAGVKLPPDIAAKLPKEVAQDWSALEPMLLAKITTPKEGN
jgi:hypothetical protein